MVSRGGYNSYPPVPRGNGPSPAFHFPQVVSAHPAINPRFSLTQFPNAQYPATTTQPRAVRQPLYQCPPVQLSPVGPQTAANRCPPFQLNNVTQFRAPYHFSNPRFSDDQRHNASPWRSYDRTRPPLFPFPRPHAPSPQPVLSSSWGMPQSCIPRLPSTVARAVASFLASERLFATLASFNVTCRVIHKVTLPFLWRTVYCNWGGASETNRRARLDIDGWEGDYRETEKWGRRRWDDKLQVAKGGSLIEFLSGPPLHRHFFVPWVNRSKWIPSKLAKTLKAAITYKIDASGILLPDPTDELEIYLCGTYRFGTHDVVALLDVIEPPLQDTQDDISLKEGGCYTRLVFFIDKAHDEPTRWYTTETGQQAARESLLSRDYPWLRYVDLVICDAERFDGEALEVVVREGLTVLTTAVQEWFKDEESRPELAVKGVNLELAIVCIKVFSDFIKDHKEFSCIVFKVMGPEIVPAIIDVATGGTLDILDPIRTAYASLWASEFISPGVIGSTVISGLDSSDQPAATDNDMIAPPPDAGVEATVTVDDDGSVELWLAEDGHLTRHESTFCYLLASQLRSWSHI